MDTQRQSTQPIAIVGMASHFPDATDLFEFWRNIYSSKDSVTENLDFEGYWKKEDFYRPNSTDKDMTYAYKAGWIPPIDFDPVEFKLPPNMLESICTAQLFALHVAKQALLDARIIGDDPIEVDRSKVGVILGGAGNGNTSFMLAARQQTPFIREILGNMGLPEELVEEVVQRLLDQYLEWNEDSFPGFLGNVACGRISSFYDFGGTSNMVDAACASSLAAMKAAIGELQSGSCDVMLTGGVNLENSIFSFLCFSRTPALSPTNCCKPFDAKSDGMMLGDGVGLLVLKRLEDAQRDGDRIYAVIKSVAGSSDGRAKSIFAPRMEGQVLAVKRAYEAAGVKPGDIELVEAHGTGTLSGDQTELSSLLSVFAEHDVLPQSVAVGSIKSQIGHTRCAAGAASAIKTALGLHHKILPATINVDQPNKLLTGPDCPIYVNTLNRPWIRHQKAGPRRAAISAFGFGGTNYHMVLEEYQHEQSGPYRLNNVPDVVVLQGRDGQDVQEQVQSWLTRLNGEDVEVAYDELVRQSPQLNEQLCARLTFATENSAQAISALTAAQQQLNDISDNTWEHPLGVYFHPSVNNKTAQGKVVALFPGQGSQYVNMALHTANEFPLMREVLAEADDHRQAQALESLSRLIYPAPAFTAEERSNQEQRLKSTDNAQPAIGAVSLGYYRILQALGFKADFAAGHSFGELTALHVAGVLSDEDFHRLAMARGRLMKHVPDGDETADRGAMLAASLSPQQAEQCQQKFDGLVIANLNSNTQVVFGGSSQVISDAQHFLQQQDVRCSVLPVSAAFHTDFVAHASEPFGDVLAGMQLKKPTMPVFSNVSATAHDKNTDNIKAALTEQLTSTVRFKQMVENLYAAGGRYFVEMGPKGVLGKLVADILGDREHQVICLDPSEKAHDGQQLRKAIARMAALGLIQTHQDPYQLRPAAPENKEKRLTYRMNGGYFFFDATKQRREKAKRPDSSLIDAFVAQHLAQQLHSTDYEPIEESEAFAAYQVHSPASRYAVEGTGQTYIYEGREVIMATPTQDNADNLGPISQQIRAQQLTNEVHQQFQQNQRDYIQFLDSLVHQQFNLFDKHQGSNHFREMIDSLNQSFSLLEQNQRSYHDNHQRYFTNQGQLLANGEQPQFVHNAEVSAVASAPLSNGESRSVSNSHSNGHSNGHAQANGHTNGQANGAGNGYAQPKVAANGSNGHSVAVNGSNGHAHGAAMHEPKVQQQTAAVQVKASQAENGLNETDRLALEQLRKVSAESLAAELVKIISDKTGYPEDMIGGDMDLEADLGIDSIKRIEIIGAMFKSFETDFKLMEDAEDYADMETFDVEQFSSINKLVAFLQEQIGEMIAHLEQGGSITEALDSKADTTKPAEVKSYSQAALKGEETERCEVAENAQQVNQEVADVMTSIGFVASSADLDGEVLHPKSEPASAAPVASAEPAGASVIRLAEEQVHETAPVQGLGRYEVKLQPLPLPDQQHIHLPEGFTWLVADSGRTAAESLMDKLIASGHKAVLLQLADKPAKTSHPAYTLAARDEDSLLQTLASIRAEHGQIGGLICLQTAGVDAKAIRNCFVAKEYAVQQQLFMLVKALQSDLLDSAAQGHASLLVAGQLDGMLGLGGVRGYPLVSAGVSGLVKSLHHEWPQVRCRYVDLQPKMADEQALHALWQELHDVDCQPLEVGRDGQGRRTTLVLCDAPLAESKPALDDKDVVLVTGGARGITATCVLELAKQTGAAFMLLGRTDINAQRPEWAKDCQDVAQLRAAAIQAVKQQGELPTPVKIDKMLGSILQAEEVQQTLNQLQELGCRASYVAVDILDKERLKQALTEAQQQLGKVTALVHGAGNLADKKLDKKTAEDFESVFGTKVRGLENLVRVLTPGSLKLLCLFSSVSGFFGNAGQTDYAMANEVLSKFAHDWQFYYPQSRVCAINWGPWDSGMVSDTLKRAYQERGICIIPSDDGARRFVAELAANTTQVLIGNDKYQQPKISAPTATSHQSTRLVCQQQHGFLSDHVIEGKPVLPATFAMSWLAQAAHRLLPGATLLAVEDFQVLKGVVFEQPEESFEVRVTPQQAAQPEGEFLLLAEIGSLASGQWQPRYKGLVRFAGQALNAPMRAVAELSAQQLDLGERPLYGREGHTGWLFHGPSLQGLQKILSCDGQGIRALVCLPAPEGVEQEIFAQGPINPYLADVFLQGPYLWLLKQTDSGGLPMAVGHYSQFSAPAFGQTLLVEGRCKDSSASQVSWDVDICDEQGQLLASFTELVFTRSKSLRSKLLPDN
ncbi:type I polyketide synthase [Bowmanella denitrificans]|uniref:type I polyketide synthase n=1 Tax=Bowmanella denitrificans TaxID=366582 RepID=UPI000C9A04E7|nr:type I polyketide synthase [Bowmanella denitrificans]